MACSTQVLPRFTFFFCRLLQVRLWCISCWGWRCLRNSVKGNKRAVGTVFAVSGFASGFHFQRLPLASSSEHSLQCMTPLGFWIEGDKRKSGCNPRSSETFSDREFKN